MAHRDPTPTVQASYMKNTFAALDVRGRLAALAAADPELRAVVDSASRLSWLPIAWNVRTVDGLAAQLGEERALLLLAECVYAQFDTPLWKSFVGGAVRLLGKDPASLGRWIPEAIGLVFRGCGCWTAESTAPGEITVQVTGLPPALATHPRWLRSIAAGIATPLFTLCGVSGHGELAAHDEAAARARYAIRWKGPADR